MKKIVILLCFLVILISITSASLPPVKQNDCANIKTILNASAVNISTISYPNGSIALTNVAMQKTGQTFNYSFCNTSTLGIYVYDYFDIEGNVYVNDFKVTKTGIELSSQETNLYILLTIILLILFGISLYFSIAIPFKNNTDEKGFTIRISKAKYIKLLFIGLTYALLVWFLNSLIGLTDNFLFLTLYYGFVSFLFTTLLHMTIVVFIFIFVVGFYNIIKDSNIHKEIKRFGKF